MSRYIDADELIFFGFDNPDCDNLFEFVPKEFIDNAPTADVVEVVRCCDADKGDCMFNHWHETPNGDKYHICNLNQLSFSEHEDFYCAYGERREDDKGRSD